MHTRLFSARSRSHVRSRGWLVKVIWPVLALALTAAESAQAGFVGEATVGVPMVQGRERAIGWRVAVTHPVPLGVGALAGELMLGYADVGGTAEGPLVQRHHRHTRGPFAGLQATLPIADGWQVQTRLGLVYGQTTLVTTVNGQQAFQASERHLGPMAGASVARSLTSALALAAAVDVGQHRFDGLPTVRPVLWSLGLSLRF